MPQTLTILLLLAFPISNSLAQKKIFIESTVNPSLFWMVDKQQDGAVYLKDPSSTDSFANFQFIQQPNITRRLAPPPIQFLLNILPPSFIISLESSAQANHYLRHFSGRLRLDPFAENPLFAGDASFKIRPALNGSPEGTSFESVNLPRSFLKQDNDLGIILAPFDPFDPELDRNPYVFKIHSQPPHHLSNPTTNPPQAPSPPTPHPTPQP
jgi:hypothetical protein